MLRFITMADMLFAVAAVLISSPTIADETTYVHQTTCPGGIPLYLWLSGDGFDCSETGGVYACTETQYGNSASADCSTGCQEIFVADHAGCFFGDGTPPTTVPNYTVTCENGRKFDLTAREGDTCSQNNEGTAGNPNITGGECSQTGEDGVKDVGVSADCQTGCGTAKPGADCKER